MGGDVAGFNFHGHAVSYGFGGYWSRTGRSVPA
jgi:hypothetical protein